MKEVTLNSLKNSKYNNNFQCSTTVFNSKFIFQAFINGATIYNRTIQLLNRIWTYFVAAMVRTMAAISSIDNEKSVWQNDWFHLRSTNEYQFGVWNVFIVTAKLLDSLNEANLVIRLINRSEPLTFIATINTQLTTNICELEYTKSNCLATNTSFKCDSINF